MRSAHIFMSKINILKRHKLEFHRGKIFLRSMLHYPNYKMDRWKQLPIVPMQELLFLQMSEITTFLSENAKPFD